MGGNKQDTENSHKKEVKIGLIFIQCNVDVIECKCHSEHQGVLTSYTEKMRWF